MILLQNGKLLGPSVDENQNVHVEIDTEVVSMARGFGYTLYIKEDGKLYGVGANQDGQLGDGTTEDRDSPVEIASEVAAVSTVFRHTLFLKNDGSLWSMGYNEFGALGD